MDNGHWIAYSWKTPDSDETGVWETVSEEDYNELKKSETEDTTTSN